MNTIKISKFFILALIGSSLWINANQKLVKADTTKIIAKIKHYKNMRNITGALTLGCFTGGPFLTFVGIASSAMPFGNRRQGKDLMAAGASITIAGGLSCFTATLIYNYKLGQKIKRLEEALEASQSQG